MSALIALTALSPAVVLAGSSSPPARSPMPASAAAVASTARAAPTPRAELTTRAAPTTGAGSTIRTGPVADWVWPLIPRPAVLRGFSVGQAVWSPGHRGVDLAGPVGAPVRAPADGTVFFAGVLAGRPVLSIDHGAVISSFEPVSSPLRRGTAVHRGEVVGRLAPVPGHCSPVACLHWGLRRNGRYLDPLSLLPGRRGPPSCCRCGPDRPLDVSHFRPQPPDLSHQTTPAAREPEPRHADPSPSEGPIRSLRVSMPVS